ncbi:MAG: type VI secretion system tip protein VgrG, partial [Desulfobacteraceae bacterium]
MGTWTQDKRIMAINTPLGKDVLLLAGIHGQEYISQPFSFDLELVSENKDISFGDIIGKEVTVTIRSKGSLDNIKDIRYIHGIIARFFQSTKPATKTADNSLFYHYEATLVPYLWLLTQRMNSRIFQKKSVPDIVRKIIEEKQFIKYKFELQGNNLEREYCVQYQETDFNFISRLLEEEGIRYYFKHGDKNATLILSDKIDNPPCPKQETAQFLVDKTEKPETDLIFSVERTGQIIPGKFSLRDFNYELPQKHREADTTGKTHGPGKPEQYEVFEFPGRFSDNNAGKAFAKIKMESHEARAMILEGAGDCRAFTSGYSFELKEAQLKKLDGKYLITLVEHLADSDLFSDKGGSYYVNHFQCIPANTPYRPLQITPKPVMRGPQTAIVVGPGGNKGEEINIDKLGRVKVQFHWDREGKNNDKSSCWIRVAQTWAGNQWGAQFIPRTGHEVVVDFLDGDPDRPLITGSVYHEQNKLPYEGESTKTGIKSKSYQGNKSVTGFNELRFEDKKDKEEFYIHAQKDFKMEVENDQT